METTKQLHAALVSSPGMGHLIPVLELGNRLVTYHGFKVTIFIVATYSSPAEDQVLYLAMSSNILEIVKLPPADISGLVNPNAATVTRLAVIMREARPSLRAAIKAMKCSPSVLIVDLFGTEALGIGVELKIPKFIYILPNAWFLALTIHTPILDKVVKGEYVDQRELLQIPGCKPVRPEDVVDPMLDRADQQYQEYVRMGTEIPMFDGILVNTWHDLEPTTLGALRDDKVLSRVVKVPVYPIGPLVRAVRPARTELLDWLDMQPSESVIYVSFGSGGILSPKQIIELAWGLELSQQRFVWVIRPPIENDAFGSFFSAGIGGDEVSRFMPDGFLSRTHKVGVVFPNWAPQSEILSHPSVGGFLSHCGWNSTLESIINGVPMIAWPLYSEQRLNATMLSEDLGIAVRPKVLPTKKVVEREEIEKMVREVMGKQGNAMRNRVQELKQSAEKALSKGGSSHNSLAQVVKICESRKI